MELEPVTMGIWRMLFGRIEYVFIQSKTEQMAKHTGKHLLYLSDTVVH